MEDNRLLEGIQRDAGLEAKEILKQAEDQVRVKNAGLDTQLAEIRKEAEADREKRLAEIRRRSESTIKTSLRRMSLKRKEYLYNLVMREAEKRLAALSSSPDYPDILAKWIAEGVIGLGRSEALVSCSFRETLTPSILGKAAELVKSSTGKTVKLQLDETSLTEQGVAVTSMDGRISFHNQVAIRFRRYDQEIKKIIYDNLIIQDDLSVEGEQIAGDKFKNKE